MREEPRRWPMFEEVERSARRLDEMLDATEASLSSAIRRQQGQAYRAARATCIACGHGRDCRLWLEARHAAGAQPGPVGPPAFCPNAAFLDACRTAETRTTPLS